MSVYKFVIALTIPLLLGAGCVPRYVPGEVPTAAQLERMSPEEIETGMQAMLVKNPAPEFDADERRTEAQAVRENEAEGKAERFSTFASDTRDVSGSVRIVFRDEKYSLTLSELFSVEAGPGLAIRITGNAGPLEVGSLRSISGGQTYGLPADFDPAKYTAVEIYSVPFQVVFAKAAFE